MSKRSIASYFQPVAAKRSKADGPSLNDNEKNGPQGIEDSKVFSPHDVQPTGANSADADGVQQQAACSNSGEDSNVASAEQVMVASSKTQQHESLQPEQQDEQQKIPTGMERQILANRNQSLARLAVTQAAGAGQLPTLQQLLVEDSWREVLESEFKQSYWTQLQAFIHSEWKATPNTIYPPKDCTFRAFNSCPFQEVRIVILGQDPYFNPGEAMGLSFSVARGVKIPSSLQNIYKELGTDLGCTKPTHGDLQKWAQQGVFLLNASLTVRGGKAGSHQKKGWEKFTDAAIKALSKNRKGLVFLLWGKWAQQKSQLIDQSKHHVLQSAHPSGLSASKGFFGCKHFSKANALLVAAGMEAIDWQIE